MAKEEGCIKWSDIIPIIITTFSMAVAIAMGALYFHSQSPHHDAVSRKEFERLTTSVDSKFDRVLNKLDRMDRQ